MMNGLNNSLGIYLGSGYQGDPYGIERQQQEQEMMMRQSAAMQNSRYNSLGQGYSPDIAAPPPAVPKEVKPNLLLLLEEI